MMMTPLSAAATKETLVLFPSSPQDLSELSAPATAEILLLMDFVDC